MKKRYYLIFLVLPLLLVATAEFLNNARGPYWVGTNFDPAYVYLLNSANLSNLKKVGHIDHPGTPVQVLGAVTIRAVHSFHFSSTDDLRTDVLKRPEYYLSTINTVMVVMNALMLFILGIITFKLTRNIWISLWLQLSPFISKTILEAGLTRVSPEPLLLFSSLLFILILVIFVHSQGSLNIKKNQLLIISLFAVVTGFGIAVKITFLPIIIIPIFLFPGLKNKILYFVMVTLSFMFFTLPIIGMYEKFFNWFYKLLTHKGHYGGGGKGIISPQLFIRNMMNLLKENYFFTLVLLISIIILIIAIIIPKIRKLSISNRYFKLLAAVITSQVIGILMVSKHSAHHYLLPVLSLTGLALFIIFYYIKNLLNHFELNANYLIIPFILFIAGASILINPIIQIKKIGNHRKKIQKKSLAIYQKVESDYKDYAKIYFYACSSPAYALKFGSDLSRNYNASALQKTHKDVYFYNIWNKKIYNYSYNQEIPYEEIKSEYGKKIIFQKAGRLKIPGLRLKKIYEAGTEAIYIEGESFLCRIRSAPGYRYTINGSPSKWNYRKQYLKGETIIVTYTGPQQAAFSHWLVNGKKYTDETLTFPVIRDTIISPVMKNEVLLLQAVKSGDVETIKKIMKGRGFTICNAEAKKRLTFLAVIEAVERGYGEVLNLLINNGTDVDIEVDKNVSLLTCALALNHPGIVEILKTAGAQFSLDQIKKSGELINDFINIELKSSEYKELKVWYPHIKKENTSPSLHIQGIRGKFKFDFEREKKRNILVVSYIEPRKDGERICQFGYSANKNGFNIEIPEGRFIYFIVRAKIPKHLINKDNYIFIQDFDGKWERKKVYFSGNDWRTCLISKKVRKTSTRLNLGILFKPQSQKDKLMVKDMKIFVSDKEL